MRASEIGIFQLSDYREREGRLYVTRVKGSKSGEYPLVDVEKDALNAWIEKRGQSPGPLFLSRKQRGISRWALDDLMKRYCTLAGIARDKAHMHSLKHSCGTHFHERVGDIAATIDDVIGEIAALLAAAYRRHAKIRLIRPTIESLPLPEGLANGGERSVHELTRRREE